MKIPPGSLKLLQAQLVHLEELHRAAVQRVEDARTALAMAREDETKPWDPEAAGPTATYRAASAEAAIKLAERRAAEALANLEAFRKAMALAEESAASLVAFEKAAAAASTLDDAMTADGVAFVGQLRTRTDQLLALHRLAAEAWMKLPNPVRDAVPMPRAQWLPGPGDDELPRRLRAVGGSK